MREYLCFCFSFHYCSFSASHFCASALIFDCFEVLLQGFSFLQSAKYLYSLLLLFGTLSGNVATHMFPVITINLLKKKKKNGARLFSVMFSQDNNQWAQKEVIADHKEALLCCAGVWTMLQVAQSCYKVFLENSKSCLDVVLGTLLCISLLEQGMDPDVPAAFCCFFLCYSSCLFWHILTSYLSKDFGKQRK